MDRLTTTGCKFLAPIQATKIELCDEIRRHQKYYDRLAAYEATDLEPDEIPQLLTLTVKLILLCEVPQEKRDKVFHRLHIGAGDYMGSGFAFVDAYHRIYDNFIETTTGGAYQAIKDEIDRQQMPQPLKGEE